MGQNYILQFGGTLAPPYVQTDSAYDADGNRVAGWPAPEVVPQDFLNKLHLQGLVTASGLSQFIADNQIDDVVDTLTPSQYAALLTAAIQAMNFTTQAQFDSTTKAATTAFVQRALGSFSSSSTYNANTVLPITDIGRAINANGVGLAFTLPLTSGVPDGSKILIRGNGSSGGVIVQRQGGSDVIANGLKGDLSYITVAQWDLVELTKQGGKWYVTGGNEQLASSSQFQYSNTANGYIKLPGGLILQWGASTLGLGVATITLPTPWLVGFLSGSVNFRAGAAPSTLGLGISGNNTTSIHLQLSGSGGPYSEGVFWIAIGT